MWTFQRCELGSKYCQGMKVQTPDMVVAMPAQKRPAHALLDGPANVRGLIFASRGSACLAEFQAGRLQDIRCQQAR